MASASSSLLQLSKAGPVPVPSTRGQVPDQVGLAARIEHQRAKIVALEHKAEERRRREARQAEDRRREVEDRRAAKVREREERQLLFRQREEQHRRDRQARDESALQAHLRHKAADLAGKAEQFYLTRAMYDVTGRNKAGTKSKPPFKKETPGT